MAYNILLVDDSETIRAVMAKTLDIAGVPINIIYEAENGKEALAILGEHWIDITFADINMPVMNGMEMVERMCGDGVLKTIPVIIVSTEGSHTRIEELRSKGVRGYVRKPFTPEIIREVVSNVLGKAKSS